MSFSRGQAVWVGYCPDRRAHASARPHRCSVGTIEAGPFEPLGKMSGTWYEVSIDGRQFYVVERMLFPFHDPGETTGVDHKKAVPA